MKHPKRVLALLAIPLLSLVLMGDACAVKTNPGGTSGSVSMIPQTALQKVIVYNAALSEANLAVGRAVRQLQQSNTITAAQARPIIEGEIKVASVSERIRAITSSGTEASWSVDGPKVRAILAETSVKLPTAANATVDLLVATVNAAATMLLSAAGAQ